MNLLSVIGNMKSLIVNSDDPWLSPDVKLQSIDSWVIDVIQENIL